MYHQNALARRAANPLFPDNIGSVATSNGAGLSTRGDHFVRNLSSSHTPLRRGRGGAVFSVEDTHSAGAFSRDVFSQGPVSMNRLQNQEQLIFSPLRGGLGPFSPFLKEQGPFVSPLKSHSSNFQFPSRGISNLASLLLNGRPDVVTSPFKRGEIEGDGLSIEGPPSPEGLFREMPGWVVPKPATAENDVNPYNGLFGNNEALTFHTPKTETAGTSLTQQASTMPGQTQRTSHNPETQIVALAMEDRSSKSLDQSPEKSSALSVKEMANRVYHMLERRLIIEKERRGIF
jgi:hypothetical protein